MKANSEPIKILCVDDERNVLKALERIFLDDDYEIVLAGSGAEGLDILQKAEHFQVVISDYRMPVMNGVEFLKVVYERCPETVRIVLSGYADAGAIVAECLHGAAEGIELTGHIEAAFGRDLFTVFRHHADEVRAYLEGDVQNFLGVAHLQIQLCANALAQQKDVRVLNMATVGAQMNGDRMSTCCLRSEGGCEG